MARGTAAVAEVQGDRLVAGQQRWRVVFGYPPGPGQQQFRYPQRQAAHGAEVRVRVGRELEVIQAGAELHHLPDSFWRDLVLVGLEPGGCLLAGHAGRDLCTCQQVPEQLDSLAGELAAYLLESKKQAQVGTGPGGLSGNSGKPALTMFLIARAACPRCATAGARSCRPSRPRC